MARYNHYVVEIDIALDSRLVHFHFDDGRRAYCDTRELAEILIKSGIVIQ